MPTLTKTRITSGIPGLDEILHGGFRSGRSYLVTGGPGSGKTIFGLQFLLAATAHSRPLFVTFSETEEPLREHADALGMNTDGITFLDLTATAETFSEVQSYDIFSSAEIEREPVATLIRQRIEQLSPERIFIDGFAQLRAISADVFQFLRLVQSFFRFATENGATLVVGSDESDCARDADGVIRLAFSDEGRSLRVTKHRGSDFHAGHYPMRLTSTGLQVPLSAA